MSSLVMYLWGFGSGWVGTNAWCNMESGYLKKLFVWYANVESFGICYANKALIRCGSGSWVGWKGCGWPFSGEVCWFYSLRCFLNTCWALLFHLCATFLFWFSTYPRDTAFNLLYLDFSFSEIGFRSAFHRFIFFAHTLGLQVFKRLVFGMETWCCNPACCTLSWRPNGDDQQFIIYIFFEKGW